MAARRRRGPVAWPFAADLRGYRAPQLRADLQAGLTVAVFAVPQAMAYALLAGVPPAWGLYAAIAMSAVASLWGSSALLNTGPTNSASLLVAAALAPIAGRDPAAAVFALTILVGLIQLSAGLLRLGWLVEFVPESVLVGFTSGAGVLIALGQLHHLLGVARSEAPGFIGRTADVLGRAGEADPAAVAVGLGTLAVMAVFRRRARRWPVALGAIALATLAAEFVPGLGGLRLVRDATPVPHGLPAPAAAVPSWPVWRDALPAALSIAAIGLLEAVSIAQTLAIRRGQAIDFDQEFVGQGLANLAGAFFRGFPGSGSFTRSVLMDHCGAATRFAGVVFSAFTAAFLFLPGALNRIPVAALAGLLLYIGCGLIDARRIRQMWITSRHDAAAMAATAAVMVLLDVKYSIFAGITVAVFLFLGRSRVLQVAEILPARHGRFEERPYDDTASHAPSDLVVVSLSGELFFGVAHLLRERLQRIVEEQRPRFLVLRTRRARSIDYSCWNALFDLAEAFHRQGGCLYLCGAHPDMAAVLQRAGLGEVVRPEQVFPRSGSIFEALERAVRAVAARLGTDARLGPEWQAEIGRYRAGSSRPGP